MFTAGSFGRRASDGGANLHIFHQQHSSNTNNDDDGGWSQPGSREQLQSVSKYYRYISNTYNSIYIIKEQEILRHRIIL